MVLPDSRDGNTRDMAGCEAFAKRSMATIKGRSEERGVRLTPKSPALSQATGDHDVRDSDRPESDNKVTMKHGRALKTVRLFVQLNMAS